MPRSSTLHKLADLAEDQWGLVTRRQAADAGIPPATLNRLASDSSVLKRVARGVYRMPGTPEPDHEALRAAWLQLAPGTPAWDRDRNDGVVSHRSAASMYGLGDLAEDRHEFTIPHRRQSRRPDVRLHRGTVDDAEWLVLRGLPVTRPSRIASDLFYDNADPTAVAHIVSDAMRGVYDYPGPIARALAPHAARFGFRRSDGLAMLDWLTDLVGDPERDFWLSVARDDVEGSKSSSPAAALTGAARR
jgi:hypothetical protein